MKKTLKTFMLASTAALLMTACGKGNKYEYETVEGDPMNTQIYTLPNGLKIYMTVNNEQPRIQTYIAVHAGGKDDPAESTGLAHYLEHLMFKGTKQFGTWNYDLEATELVKIDSLYEVYNHTTDAALRKAIYHEIDSVSYEASRYAIPNEYDKLMATIGSDGSNAFTSEDVTCYQEDIPANQLENWAKIQSDRFQNMVIRLFHTELEAVYEEKNMSMTRDMDKVIEAVSAALYPNHPYGTQTVIGTQEHLKNPSLINIRKYFENYYRPNNVAICLSGDFNPDEVVDIIQQYFGEWQANDNLTRKEVKPQPAISAPIFKEVIGEEAENVWVAWRTPAEKEDDNLALEIAASILQNGTAGLIDLDLIQPHKLMAGGSFNNAMEQGAELMLYAYPMPGQSLDEARQLLLEEVDKLKKGDFDDRLLASVLTDYKLSVEKSLEENESRAMKFVNSFISGQTWAESVEAVKKTEALTKEDIIRVANKYLGNDNYVCVNKRQGVDTSIAQIEKPEINPVMTNRDSTSHFLREIQEAEVQPIAPVFIDYKKDLSFGKTSKDLEVIYKENTLNGFFQMAYVYDMGTDADREIETALEYIDYLGTDKMSAEEIKKSFYALGCSINAKVTGSHIYLMLSGLDENKAEALHLVEDYLANLKPDEEALSNLKMATLQGREVNMADQNFFVSSLRRYATYGLDYVKAHILTNEEIMALDAQQLVDKVKGLKQYAHTVTYYGPSKMDDVISLVEKEHKTAEKLLPTPASPQYVPTETPANVVYLCHYPAPNAHIFAFSNLQETFSPDIEPARTLYNEYFGGGMNSIVFQEIRESRGLAYSCRSYFTAPGFTYDPYTSYYYAATQVDKLGDCMSTFQDIVENMPQSKAAFSIAKQALITRLRTQRTTRDAIIWSYLDARDLGLDTDINQTIFEHAEQLDMKTLLDLQKKYIKARTHCYSIVADRSRIDMDVVRSLGTVTDVDIKDICGFY